LGTINPFRYRSYYYDEETQLYYLNSRHYNPILKRFLNIDIVITGQDINSANIINYCNNNPINRKDTKGNWYYKPKIYKESKGYTYKEVFIKRLLYGEKGLDSLKETTQNCYAFATGLSNEFLNPGRGFYNKDWTVDEIAEQVIKDFPNDKARRIDGFDSPIGTDEYIIAVRVNEKMPWLPRGYHFIVRYDNGEWAEKKGLSSSRILTGVHNPDEDGAWSSRMNSKTVYLAVKKD
jgi:RHS repeat-associated protein